MFTRLVAKQIKYFILFIIILHNGVRKIFLIQRLNNIIFLAPLADICTCFKQKLTKY